MFTQQFDSYVCEGGNITCEVDGFACTATVYRDTDHGAPWDAEDGHGPVSEWTRRRKRAGELVLCEDRGSRRYYDFAEACRIARRDGWRLRPEHPSDKEPCVASEAARADFEYLRTWCNNEWHYVGVDVTVSKAGINLTGQYRYALRGIECNVPGSDNSCLRDVANDLLPEALEAARAKLSELCAQECPNNDHTP